MKIKLLTLAFAICFIFPTILNGQDISASKDSLFIKGANSNGQFDFADLYGEFIFKNINVPTDSFRWKRTLNMLPSNKWESAVCDINLCYGTGVDSADFIMTLGDSGTLYTHFYPGTGSGTAQMTLEVYSIANPSIKVTINSYATAWDAYNNVSTTKLENNLVYPNPTSEGYIYVKASEALVSIKNIEGKTVLSQQIENINPKFLTIDQSFVKIDVSTLAKGVYFVEVKDKESVKIQKIIIQ